MHIYNPAKFHPDPIWNNRTSAFLADPTAARSTVGYWHDTVVCLSVCNTVHRGAQDWCWGWKIVSLAVHFLFTSSDTFAAGDIIIYHKTRQMSVLDEKLTRKHR